MKKTKGILIIALIFMLATFFWTGCGDVELESSASASQATSTSESTVVSESESVLESTSESESVSSSSYTITFDSDGGRKVQSQVKQENELLEKPDLVYKIIHHDGEYELEGWYFGEIKWDFDTMTVEGDMVLKARWNKIEDYPKPEI